MRAAKTLILASLFSGAAAAASGCAVFRSRDEFVAFRAYRYEQDPDQKTALAAQFLETYPVGPLAAQVRREVADRDEEYWELHRATLEGLRAYALAYPSGGHAIEARARIEAYEGERRRLEGERAERERLERERLENDRRQANERVRLFARNTMAYWMHTLTELDGWGESIGTVAQRNAEFNTAFGGEPRPACSPGRCRKLYRAEFTIPVPGRTAIQRSLGLALDLMFRDRRLQQANLVLQRRGLTNWFECETQTPAASDNPDSRTAAVQWSMNALKGVVAAVFPTARETPTELLGPEPEMEGAVADDGTEASPSAASTGNASPIPAQPLGVQFSYVVGCGSLGGAVVTAPENSLPQGWVQSLGQAASARGCFRLDGYAAPDIEGVNTDEGLRISYIPATALPRATPARPGRPVRR